VLLAAPAGVSQAGPFSLISDSENITAVASRVYNGYARKRHADGSPAQETYAFGDGGLVSGIGVGSDVVGVSSNGGDLGAVIVSDATVDDLDFIAVAKTIAGPLAERNYVPTRDPDATNLFIMVYWGRTQGSNGVFSGGIKDAIDFRNAQLLGFDSESSVQALADRSTAFWGRSFRTQMVGNVHADVFSALEVNRYYVVLRAFDFQSAWKKKKIKLLWETRFSLSERLHDFTKELPNMALSAAQYFGQDTRGVVLKPLPEGHVDIGAVKSLGDMPEK
jgi:hypothetical protein